MMSGNLKEMRVGGENLDTPDIGVYRHDVRKNGP